MGASTMTSSRSEGQHELFGAEARGYADGVHLLPPAEFSWSRLKPISVNCPALLLNFQNHYAV
jgi:hypothetical protein